MTTYGTIPTTHPHPSNNNNNNNHHELISRATTHIQSHLATRRPWPELLSLSTLSVPPSFNDAISRATSNLSYFRTNYTIIILITLFLSLITHPISLIVFIAMMAGWTFLYFFRDAPLNVLGRVVDDNVVLIVLGVATVLFLLLTDVTLNIVVGILVGFVLCLLHSGFQQIDDLRVGGGEFEDERVGLKGNSSSSYSS